MSKKIIVFTKYAVMAEIIKRELGFLQQTKVLVATGKSFNKESIIDEFKKTEQDSILIATDCLSQGVNLQCADTVINFDLPWTPAGIEQRIGRIDRIGQKQKLLIIDLIVEDSFEERVLELLRIKEGYVGKVVNFSHFFAEILARKTKAL